MPRFTVRTNCEFSLSIEADNADAAAALAREVPDSGWDAAWGPRPNRNLGRARALPLGGMPLMGDRAWAKLVIGGPVNRETLAELVLDEGYDLGDAAEGTEGDEGLYLERRGGGHVVVLEDCDQLGAMWEGLEAALVDAGIAFDRFSQGYAGSWSDSIAAWRGGMPRVYETVADANHANGYGRLEEIRAALAQAASLDDVRAWFSATHPDIPPLEPITWLPEESDAETLNA